MRESVSRGGDVLAGPGRAASVPSGRAARPDGAPSSEPGCDAFPVSAFRVQVEALSKAVGEVLSCFGLGEVTCAGAPGTTDVSATAHDLTVLDHLSPTGRGELHGALVFGFEATVARAFAARIADVMFDGSARSGAGEGPGLVRLALGEMASFTMLATLNTLGLPPEPPQLRLVAGKGMELSPAPRVAKGLRVTTDLGAFEIAFAPGAPLGGALELPVDVAPRARAAAPA